MKKNSVFVLGVLFSVFMVGCATPPVVSGDGVFEYTLEKFGPKTATITNWFGTETGVGIPSEIDGNLVSRIGTSSIFGEGKPGPFEGKSLNSLIFQPEWFTYIGVRAFASNNLTAVVLPKGLASIYYRAFADNKLTSVTIPAGATNHTVVGLGSFKDTTFLDGKVFAGNPIESFIFGGTIICKTSDSLGPFTPYYYANACKPGIYTRSGSAWAYNRSALLPPAEIVVMGCILQAVDGNAVIYTGNRWIPSGTHTLTVGVGTVLISPSGAQASASTEIRQNLEPGMVYLIKKSEDGNSASITLQGPWSPPQ